MIKVIALIQSGTIIIEKEFSIFSLDTAEEEISSKLSCGEYLIEIITKDLNG